MFAFLSKRCLSILYLFALGSVLIRPALGASAPYEETEKKHSWFSFSRPAKSNPEEQLAWAESLRADGRFKRAGRAFHALVLTWPRAPQAAPAQLGYAQMLEERSKWEDSFDEYERLIDKYVGQFDYEAVLTHQFVIAQTVLNRRKGKFLIFGGFRAPERAVPMFESILKRAPQWNRAAECQYLIAMAYELSDQLELAVVSYMSALHRFPESAFAEKSAFGRAHCLYRLAEESPNDEELLEQAWAAVVVFLNSFPDSEQHAVASAYRDNLYRRRAEVYYHKAEFYDKVARKPKAAQMSYEQFVRMFPQSEWVNVARQRISELSSVVEKSHDEE